MLGRMNRVSPSIFSWAKGLPVARQYSTLILLSRTSTIPNRLSPNVPGTFYQCNSRRPLPIISLHPRLAAAFHSTPPNHGLPLIPLLASMLKASTGFELARTASRIALTFIPFLWIHNMKTKKMIKYAALHGFPTSEEQKAKHLGRVRSVTTLLKVLIFIPFALFWATIIASLERTPLTGRWRMILLSPEEEDQIAEKLAGEGWYRAVGDILAQEGSPRAISVNDWRYQWVNDTLRRLESNIPVLSSEEELCPNWIESGEDCAPLPPPTEFPLRPRPRASEYLHWFCNKMTQKDPSALAPGGIAPGVPYSLLVIEKSENSNAFSYGFGPDGGSGIVVYTGFLDEILAKYPPLTDEIPTLPTQKSFLQSIFGRLFSGSPSPPSHPKPSPEATAELAILLAHEMSHLLLSHHLESLSSVAVVVPGTLSIAADIVRVLLFPITMFFGPFVNDAVAQLGKVGSGELVKISEYCSSIHQEIEADVVSARLLAHAGFDARATVRFWEQRSGEEGECAKPGKLITSEAPSVARKIMGDSNTHPISEMRVNCIKDELARWETERRKAIKTLSRSSSLSPSTGT